MSNTTPTSNETPGAHIHLFAHLACRLLAATAAFCAASASRSALLLATNFAIASARTRAWPEARIASISIAEISVSSGLIGGLGGGVFVERTSMRSLPVGAITESGGLGGGVSDERMTTRSVSVGRGPVFGLSEGGGFVTWVARNVMVSDFLMNHRRSRGGWSLCLCLTVRRYVLWHLGLCLRVRWHLQGADPVAHSL